MTSRNLQLYSCTGAPKLINSDLFLEKCATVPIKTGTVAHFSRNKSSALLISFGAHVIPVYSVRIQAIIIILSRSCICWFTQDDTCTLPCFLKDLFVYSHNRTRVA